MIRSFEIAAIVGCMLAEDTEEHPQIFDGDETCAVYFRNARRSCEVIVNPERRRSLAFALREGISNGMHTYRDRLLSIFSAVERQDRWALKPFLIEISSQC